MKKSKNRLIEILVVVFISTFVGMITGTAAIYSIINNNDKKDFDVSKTDEIDNVFDKIVNDYYL